MRGVKYCMAEGTLNEILKVRIPVSEFPLQGIAEFTLYDEKGLPVAERLVYLNPKRKLNIDMPPSLAPTKIGSRMSSRRKKPCIPTTSS